MKFLSKLEEFLRKRSKEPWAKFETAGVEDGLVKYEMSWNPAFLENLKKAGFSGHNEQEIVENFFLGSIIIPKEDALNEEFEKNLNEAEEIKMTSERNKFKS
jgi:hypothetical protein